MGRLIDGEWSAHDLGPDEHGRYVRRAAKFRQLITSDGSTDFAPERDRYHLYVSYACGWSHRALLFWKLKRLESVVGVSFVQPFMGQDGWTFARGGDPILGKDKLYEIYLLARNDYTGRATVPVLWDKRRETIVNNESVDIIRMFDGVLAELAPESTTKLFVPELEEAISEQIETNYESINNGVYRAGFAGSQQAHEEAVQALFARFDELETLLAEQRFLCGSRMTAADLCLFPTLYRFDPVYHVHFKCNLKRLVDYPNLWGYTRDVYQTPGVAETCRLTEVKEHYYTSHESISPRRLVPLGPQVDYDAPHDRAKLG